MGGLGRRTAEPPGQQGRLGARRAGPGHGVWITNTVGFAGPGQRYTLAITYDLQNYGQNGNTGFRYGSNKLTQIAALLFQGHHTPLTPRPQPSAVP